jgi:transcriptional regulator with XRE-family HTH domain
MTISANGTSHPANYETTTGNNGSKEPRFHRIAEVRREQGISLRSAARQLNLDTASVRYQEKPATDLRLSDLQRWQHALEVPIADLLVDPGTPLSRPVMERARLVKLMKTAQAISEQAEAVGLEGIHRMATMMVQQLTEVMPELAHISAWHSVGQRRSLDDYGRVVERRLRDDFFISYHDE